jgi:FkbM family methyltransferase
MSRLSRWLRSRKAARPTPYEHLRRAPRYETRTIQLCGKDFRVADGPSFCASYREIFQQELYRFASKTAAPLIVDCGANCGVSVVYFKRIYPRARIVAVEADPHIFSLLEWNVAWHRLTDVTLLNKAITVGCTPVTFHCQGADAGRIHNMESARERCTVPAIELDELLNEPVELLKIDIEGAETEAICSSQRLGVAAQIFCEYHSFADAPQSLHPMLAKLSTSGFRYYLHTQHCAKRPLIENDCHLGMDLQVNVFAKRVAHAGDHVKEVCDAAAA